MDSPYAEIGAGIGAAGPSDFDTHGLRLSLGSRRPVYGGGGPALAHPAAGCCGSCGETPWRRDASCYAPIACASPKQAAPGDAGRLEGTYAEFVAAMSEAERTEFDTHHLKLTPCSRRYVHDWGVCAYAHSGETARRRDPGCYVPIACPSQKQEGKCTLGDACRFAHSAWEFWLHPARYHTQMCSQGAGCKRKICFFAHHPSELRMPERIVAPGSKPGSGGGGAPGTPSAHRAAAPRLHASPAAAAAAAAAAAFHRPSTPSTPASHAALLAVSSPRTSGGSCSSPLGSPVSDPFGFAADMWHSQSLQSLGGGLAPAVPSSPQQALPPIATAAPLADALPLAFAGSACASSLWESGNWTPSPSALDSGVLSFSGTTSQPMLLPDSPTGCLPDCSAALQSADSARALLIQTVVGQLSEGRLSIGDATSVLCSLLPTTQPPPPPVLPPPPPEPLDLQSLLAALPGSPNTSCYSAAAGAGCGEGSEPPLLAPGGYAAGW